jgi:hypothetical protein
MAAMIGRFYTSLIAPPIVEKNSKDVIIIQAIAARDRTRAEPSPRSTASQR